MFEGSMSLGPAGFTSLIMRNSQSYSTHEGKAEKVEVQVAKETGDSCWLPVCIVAVFLLAVLGMLLVSLWEK